jgi:hypothetical protein
MKEERTLRWKLEVVILENAGDDEGESEDWNGI